MTVPDKTKALADLEADLAAAREALRGAIDFAEEGWGYADDYFKTKWGYTETMAKLRALSASGAAPREPTTMVYDREAWDKLEGEVAPPAGSGLGTGHARGDGKPPQSAGPLACDRCGGTGLWGPQ